MSLTRGDVDQVAGLEHQLMLEAIAPLDAQCAGQHVDGALAVLVVMRPGLRARWHAEHGHVDVLRIGGGLRYLAAADDTARNVPISTWLDDLHGATHIAASLSPLMLVARGRRHLDLERSRLVIDLE